MLASRSSVTGGLLHFPDLIIAAAFAGLWKWNFIFVFLILASFFWFVEMRAEFGEVFSSGEHCWA